VTRSAIAVGSARDCSGRPYRGASSDRSCAILKHPLNLKKGFQVSNPIRVAVLGFWHVHAAEYAARVREHPNTPDGVIGVVETGFVSNNPFTIEMHGTRASLAYDSTRNQLKTHNAGEDTWKSLSVPGNDADAFSQWVSHIQDGTRADDNLTRAVELTRLVSAANTAAATGATVRYGMSTA
jgi:predicted dehydrogenase